MRCYIKIFLLNVILTDFEQKIKTYVTIRLSYSKSFNDIKCVCVQDLRAAFEAEAKETGNDRLLLSAAVGAGKSTVDSAYEIGKIAQ